MIPSAFKINPTKGRNMNLDKVIEDMKKCYQIPDKQTVWEHGESVQRNLNTILDFLLENKSLPPGWIIPCWLTDSKDIIVSFLYSREILNQYSLFHDLGKPYCQIRDEAG